MRIFLKIFSSHFPNFFMLRFSNFFHWGGGGLMAENFFIIFFRRSPITYGFLRFRNGVQHYQKKIKTKKHVFYYFCVINKRNIPIQGKISSQYMDKLKIHVKRIRFTKRQVLKCIALVWANFLNFKIISS